MFEKDYVSVKCYYDSGEKGDSKPFCHDCDGPVVSTRRRQVKQVENRVCRAVLNHFLNTAEALGAAAILQGRGEGS